MLRLAAAVLAVFLGLRFIESVGGYATANIGASIVTPIFGAFSLAMAVLAYGSFRRLAAMENNAWQRGHPLGVISSVAGTVLAAVSRASQFWIDPFVCPSAPLVVTTRDLAGFHAASIGSSSSL